MASQLNIFTSNLNDSLNRPQNSELRIVRDTKRGTYSFKKIDPSLPKPGFFKRLGERFSSWYNNQKVEDRAFSTAVLLAMSLKSVQNGMSPTNERVYSVAKSCLGVLDQYLEHDYQENEIPDRKRRLIDEISILASTYLARQPDATSAGVMRRKMQELVADSKNDRGDNIGADWDRGFTPSLSIDGKDGVKPPLKPHPATIFNVVQQFAAFTRESQDFSLRRGFAAQISQAALRFSCMFRKHPTAIELLRSLLAEDEDKDSKLIKLMRFCTQSMGNQSYGQLLPVLMSEGWNLGIPPEKSEREMKANIKNNETVELVFSDRVCIRSVDDPDSQISFKYKTTVTCDPSLDVKPEDVSVEFSEIAFSSSVPPEKQERMRRFFELLSTPRAVAQAE